MELLKDLSDMLKHISEEDKKEAFLICTELCPKAEWNTDLNGQFIISTGWITQEEQVEND